MPLARSALVLRLALGALLLAGVLAMPRAASAQRARVVTMEDSLALARAQQLVSEGAGPAGRRLVDSVLATSAEGSPRFAEALFWRAALSASAADAERDYRRLSVEYALSPRAADALVRLAQLELARGDRDVALRHLERLAREHPTSPALPRASYWMARVLFEANDVARACDALATARATAPAADVELRNQVDFHARRCDSVPTVTAAPTPAPAAAPAAAARPPAPRVDSAAIRRAAARLADSTRALEASRTAAAARADSLREAASRRVEDSLRVADARADSLRDAATRRTADSLRTVAARRTTDSLRAVATRRTEDSLRTVAARRAADSLRVAAARRAADSVAAARAAAATPAAPAPAPAAPAAAAPASGAARFAIQVAAYDSEQAAQSLVTRLTARGLDAHIVPGQGFYRVRVGRYETRAAATAALRDLREKRIEGYVVP